MTQKRRTVQVTGVEMDVRIVPVPAERVEVWRSMWRGCTRSWRR